MKLPGVEQGEARPARAAVAIVVAVNFIIISLPQLFPEGCKTLGDGCFYI
jgi:hypothetical protein